MASAAVSTSDLRASVFETAMSLGLNSSVMAKWMCETVEEAEEEDEQMNPGLSCASSSTASTTPRSISGDSSNAYNFQFAGAYLVPNTLSNLQPHTLDPGSEQVSMVRSSTDEHFIPTAETSSMENSSFSHAHPSQMVDEGTQSTPKDWKKKFGKATKRVQSETDYESDGGYISDSGKKSRKTLKWGKKKSRGDGTGQEIESEGAYLSDATSVKKSKTKSRWKKAKEDPPALPGDPRQFLANLDAALSAPIAPVIQADPSTGGYLTDSSTKRGRTKSKHHGGKKTSGNRTPSPYAGDASLDLTDSMANTPSRKKSFFRLMSTPLTRDKEKERDRETKGGGSSSPPPPPVPQIPQALPIAEKFSRSTKPLPAVTIPLTPTVSQQSSSPVSVAPPPLTKFTSKTSDVRNRVEYPLPILPNSSPGSDGSPDFPLTPFSDNLADQISDLLNDKIFAKARRTPPIDSHSAKSSIDSTAQDSSFTVATTPTRLRTKSEANSRSPSPPPKPSRRLPFTPEKRRGKKSSTSSADSIGSGSTTSFAASSSDRPILKISSPNPHLVKGARPPPSPLKLAAAIKSRVTAHSDESESENLAPVVPSRSETPLLSPSYVFFDGSKGREGRETVYDVAPSSAHLVPSPIPSPLAGARTRSPTPQGHETPERAVTPTQKTRRAPSPLHPSAPRQSVLAYYALPPPSPAPTGPLPRLPALPDDQSRRFVPESRSSEDNQVLPLPPRSPAARTPVSPYTRGVSPAFGVSASVRRGKESPFPMRPILPREEVRTPIRRVMTTPDEPAPVVEPLRVRRKANSDEGHGRSFDEPFVDRDDSDDVSLTFGITNTRGHKRVMFHEQENEEEDIDFDDESVIRLAYDDDGEDSDVKQIMDKKRFPQDIKDDTDVRSIASVYSRYSVLDAEKSANTREGFVRQLEAQYGLDIAAKARGQGAGRGRGRGWSAKDIPAVPELPAALRVAGKNTRGMDQMPSLKSSSPFMF